jgi:23S rRNA (uracil1939-C5)-methyltransferase
MLEEVQIEKLVNGGQGLGVLKDGRKVFVWNALPGETVRARITKSKKDYAEGIAEEILKASKERIKPIDEAYLSTSPWQILTWDAENKYKTEILKEVFSREKIHLPKFDFIAAGKAGPVRFSESEFISEGPLGNPPGVFHYRNKMEYSFWGDDDGLHLALFHRASHGKRIVQGSSIAKPEIDEVANNIVAILNKKGVRASSLKTLVLRADKKGNVVAALFTKEERFPLVEDLKNICRGVTVYFSNPRSPASVTTKKLYEYGSIELSDTLLKTEIIYDVNSFFQVNLPIFEIALAEIKNAATKENDVVDMYAGVGTIGLAVGANKLIELDAHNTEMAKRNTTKRTEVIQTSAEQALEHISEGTCVVFDPPRAGLHPRVTERILEIKPTKIIYLSCNPSTQARDLAKLQETYKITSFTGYNFFPRTPHIESLGILELR